jgi:hypothetical protein
MPLDSTAKTAVLVPTAATYHMMLPGAFGPHASNTEDLAFIVKGAYALRIPSPYGATYPFDIA